MFRLISIQQINDGTDQDPSNRPYRCTILSDDTSAPPVDGTNVEGMHPGQIILPGSVCITPARWTLQSWVTMESGVNGCELPYRSNIADGSLGRTQ